MKHVGILMIGVSLIVSVVSQKEPPRCLLCEFSLSAPYNPIDFDKTPMWHKPCSSSNFSFLQVAIQKESNKVRREMATYKGVKEMAKAALQEFSTFKERWSIFTFHRFFIQMEKDWWVTHQLAKYLPDYKTTKKANYAPIVFHDFRTRETMYPKLYEWLQRVAVGLEQAVFDAYKYRDPFRRKFWLAWDNLEAVLCELDAMMTEFKIKKLPDVDRKIMANDLRDPNSNETRNIRDFQIFRQYVNLLQYAENFSRQLEKFTPHFSWNTKKKYEGEVGEISYDYVSD